MASLQRRKDRWAAFLDMNSRRRALLICDVAGLVPDRPPYYLWPENRQKRVEWAYRSYANRMEAMEWLDDDSLPYLDALSGTELFAEAFGCPVHRDPELMPHARPLVFSALEASRLKVPSLDAPGLAAQFEVADRLLALAGGEALLSLPDIQTPLGIAALIWEKSDFYCALLQTPDAVFELMEKVYELLVKFLDEWFSRYGDKFIAHFPAYYMTKGVTVSEDEIGAIGAPMFDAFAMPYLERLSARYGGIGIHCCADAEHQWDNLAAVPGLGLLNLNQSEQITLRAYRRFEDVCAQWHSFYGRGAPQTWPAQLPPGAHAVLSVNAEDKEQAIGLCARMREAIAALES